MCSKYWNLNTKIKCPKCGKQAVWNLQTHFMGDDGSCINEYKLGEKVGELKGVSVLLDGENDDFIGSCPHCEKFFDFGAEIVKGKVERVFQLVPITKNLKVRKPGFWKGKVKIHKGFDILPKELFHAFAGK